MTKFNVHMIYIANKNDILWMDGCMVDNYSACALEIHKICMQSLTDQFL